MTKKKPSKIPKKRNLAAKQSVDQKAGPMKVKTKKYKGIIFKGGLNYEQFY